MKRMALILSIIFLSFSCSQNSIRPNERTPQSIVDLISNIPITLNQINDPDIFNENSCTQYLGKLSNTLYNLPTDYFYPKNQEERSILISNGINYYQNLIELNLALQSRFRHFSNPTQECISSVRKGIRFTRYATDGIADWLFENKYIKANELIFSDVGTQTIVSSEAKEDVVDDRFIPQTGDVILMRGQTFVSSMIARVANEATGFAHLAVIGEDDSNNKFILESLIETGVTITPFDEWMKKAREVRLVVYRHKDNNLRKTAGKLIYNYSKNKINADGQIPYDFTMNPEDHSQIFCAELVQLAFELASNNNLVLPKHKSSFSKLISKRFMMDIGVTKSDSFAPGDIELEPNFEAVAEYRQFSALRKIKVQDAVMTSMFNWMIEKNYNFSPNPKAYILSNLAWIARQFGIGKKQMQKHMKPAALGTLIKFQDVTSVLEKEFLKLDKDYFSKNGYFLSFKDLLGGLEQFRLDDCQFYKEHRFDVDNKNNQSSKFHLYFNTDNDICE
jgi:hypothetical protein